MCPDFPFQNTPWIGRLVLTRLIYIAREFTVEFDISSKDLTLRVVEVVDKLVNVCIVNAQFGKVARQTKCARLEILQMADTLIDDLCFRSAACFYAEETFCQLERAEIVDLAHHFQPGREHHCQSCTMRHAVESA